MSGFRTEQPGTASPPIGAETDHDFVGFQSCEKVKNLAVQKMLAPLT